MCSSRLVGCKYVYEENSVGLRIKICELSFLILD